VGKPKPRSILSKWEKRVLGLRFGIGATPTAPKTLEEVENALKIPRESARAIEAKAIRKLCRHPLEAAPESCPSEERRAIELVSLIAVENSLAHKSLGMLREALAATVSETVMEAIKGIESRVGCNKERLKILEDYVRAPEEHDDSRRNNH